jgi:hypothetical protein
MELVQGEQVAGFSGSSLLLPVVMVFFLLVCTLPMRVINRL